MKPPRLSDRALLELLWSTGIRRGEVAKLEIYSADFSRRILTIVQGKGKQDRVIPVGERALWWLKRYLHHVRPSLLAAPDCKALFLAMDGLAGLQVNGITMAVVPYLRASGIISLPYNEEIFKSPTVEAFNSLFKMAYPESTQDDEYPDQVFDFCASPTIINDSGAYFFAIANERSVRIIGGKITKLVDGNDGRIWEDIEHPRIEDIIIPKNEISEIIKDLKNYSTEIF